MSFLGVIGPTSLYLIYGWLLSVIIASDLSDRKGYGERPGLASGLLATVLGAVAWLLVPPRAGSPWSRNVRIGDIVTAAAAIVLFVSLLLTWYSGGRNFFNEAAFYELLVPLGAVIGYGHLHARASGKAIPALPKVVLASSALAVLTTIVAIVTPPSGRSVELWAYVGLVAAVVMTAGAALAARADRGATDAPATVAEARRADA